MVKNKNNNIALSFFLSLFCVLIILAVLGLNLSLIYKNKFYPNTKISNINIAGKTKEEALKIIEEENKIFIEQNNIEIEYRGEKKIIPLSEISASYNAKNTIDSIFSQTHNNIFYYVFGSLSSLFQQHNYKQQIKLDGEKLISLLSEFTKSGYEKPEDAKLEIINDSIVFNEAKNGSGADIKSTIKLIKENISKQQTGTIQIEKTKLSPDISDIDLAQAYFKISFLLQNKGFDLKKGSAIVYNVDSKDLKNWLKFEKKTFASFEDTGIFKGKVAGVSISAKDDGGIFLLPQLVRNDERIEANIDEQKISNFVELIASRINKKPEDAKLSIANNAIVVSKKEIYGQELDQKELLKEINLRLNSSSENDIELKITPLIPEIRSNNISDLGIKEIIAVGESSFSGSPKNRINNLTIGASKFNGAIIKPNQVASFAEIVGSVEPEDGYLPELVIKGKQTIQEYGGGMCQVSTTFYRAALNAGSPIIERRPHAYLVGYYKDGPDATVYVPSTDLKWKNDTGHYILIQTRVDPVKKKMFFELWGSNDGRKVTISPPSFIDPVPAPAEPYFVDDPAYPTGYLVEEEHAHEGVTGIIIRTITYPDGKTKTDEIKSVYKPWPAKFRRGTGPADLPIPPKE